MKIFKLSFLAGFFISSLIMGSARAVFIEYTDDTANNVRVTLRFGNAPKVGLQKNETRKTNIENIVKEIDDEITLNHSNKKISAIEFQLIANDEHSTAAKNCIKGLKDKKHFMQNVIVGVTNPQNIGLLGELQSLLN